MKKNVQPAANIDEYIAEFPEDTGALLQQMRKTIKAAAPKAEEAISYAMPTFKLYGNLVHFAAFKNHIGFYPAPAAVAEFQEELAKYKTAKGSIQFPLTEPLPLTLVKRMVKYRVQKVMEKENAKRIKA